MAAPTKKVDNKQLIAKAQQKARTDPVWFAREILQLKALPGEETLESNPTRSWELDEWTVELLEAAADVVRYHEGLPTKVNHDGLNQISVRAMHGPGKTFGLALLMHWFGFSFKCKMPMTAPKMDQLKRRLWPEFRKISGRAIPSYQGLTEVNGETIYWRGKKGKFDPDHWAFMETASRPENLQGLHDDYMLVGADEATGIVEPLWPVILSSTANIIGIFVIIANPTKLQGTFADTHLKPMVAKSWYKIHVSLDKTARVRAKKRWLEGMIAKYGKDSPVVKIRCYGEFSEEDDNQLISMSWLERSLVTDWSTDGSLPRYRLSVDCADGGGNFSVITHALHENSQVLLKKQYQYNFPSGDSVVLLSSEVDRLWDKFGMSAENGDDIVVDSLGVGAGVCSILAANGRPVVNYKGGAASDNKDLYRCRRVQSYLVCRDYYRDGKMFFDPDFVDHDEWDDLYGQLCSIRIRPGTERFEDLLTKEQMRIQGITSPDRADSIAMQFATQSPMHSVVDPASILVLTTTETSRYDGALS